MEGFYIGLMFTIGVLGYKEHIQLCKLDNEIKQLKILLDQNKIKQEKIKLSLKDIFD